MYAWHLQYVTKYVIKVSKLNIKKISALPLNINKMMFHYFFSKFCNNICFCFKYISNYHFIICVEQKRKICFHQLQMFCWFLSSYLPLLCVSFKNMKTIIPENSCYNIFSKSLDKTQACYGDSKHEEIIHYEKKTHILKQAHICMDGPLFLNLKVLTIAMIFHPQ